ncbi:hypothetical protein KOR42_06320 [Thalassoglobus neptunius]|uniref:Tll0287-like domain-containing protein n=1 Tax=Thalassoglobus neptunius TaxID=1938619 RepID=A0A5C5X4W0_9PLAN|nr:DUF3365 domain-containing protein [Thalassoglobus neptunius]TWT57273.1 hypothetical protein KOR42_06320 [Thalassoglobus neptunius]
MKNVMLPAVAMLALAFVLFIGLPMGTTANLQAEEAKASKESSQSVEGVDQAAVKRARQKVGELDNIFKQTIVLITDKYVHGDDDFAAGSAAVLLFKNISDSGETKIRLIDATGDPYEPENVAKDSFEKSGIKKLKKGAQQHEQVVVKDDSSYLRVMTPVPVVMEKCVMCHAHYADVAEGAPIGAISYTFPIE